MNSGEGAWLCNKPPWGHLVAVNAATGDIAWKISLGITEELPEDNQKTGRVNFGGPITTAGGLVFIGATNDRRFRAFDSRTGEELWVTKIGMSARAVPITYSGQRRQAVRGSGGGWGLLGRQPEPARESNPGRLRVALEIQRSVTQWHLQYF